MTPEITVDWLLARVFERDGCLIWNGRADNGSKNPRSVIDKQRFYVRRAVWSAMHDGRELSSDLYAGVKCNEPCCVDPAHIAVRTRSQALRGMPKSPQHKAKIAATKRATSKLPQDKVPEILLSPLSGAEEAKRHGISKDMVNQIRALKVRRDYATPFTGLGAR